MSQKMATSFRMTSDWIDRAHTIDRVHDRPVILVLGPTAGGKTSLAIELALRLPGGGECICADSMQVYRGMDIGTAKPTREERARVPHHVLDLVEPNDDSFSVDRWLELTQIAIADIRGRRLWPIIVGGTNLYVQAFLFGLLRGPEPDPELRARLGEMDAGDLRQHLQRVDPKAAARIHINDRKRTIRAIEVFEQTGTPLSQLQTQWDSGVRTTPDVDEPSAIGGQPTVRSDVFIVGLNYAVELINRRINARVREMMDAGFLEEVRALHAKNKLGRNAREALGYKQLIDHLEGRCGLDEAVEQIKIRTRQYAKQQRTWLKRFRTVRQSTWITADHLDAQDLAAQALATINSM
jgi:tRNA dimethylallyltransferase